MIVYNRKTKKLEQETEYGDAAVKFLYDTICGRCLLKCIVARPFFSKIRALYQKSPRSRKDIMPFIRKYRIDMTEYTGQYNCFQDFFTRKRKIIPSCRGDELPAIADSKLLVYRIDKDLRLDIKHSSYSIREIVKKDLDLEPFENGFCLIFRLSVSDYHRYHFIDNGKYIQRYSIPGLLHTVRPVSSRYRVYSRNHREVSLLETEQLGSVIQIEIGALLVGCIRNHDTEKFLRLEEKGYFEYGGSTILLFLQDRIKIDPDIMRNSRNKIETKVKTGERIGEIIDPGYEKTSYLF